MDTITTTASLLKSNGSAQPVTVALMPNELRLIAAAPSLVEAVKLLESLCAWLLNAFGPDSPAGKEAQFRLEAARTALRLALGETE